MAKYKHMFDSLQESIMVVSDSSLSFLNSKAATLLCQEKAPDEAFHEELFYIY